MNKIFTYLLILIFAMTNVSTFAAEKVVKDKNAKKVVNCEQLGNKISEDEYPDCSKIAPYDAKVIQTINKDEMAENSTTIEGSVEKTLDVTLSDCIKFALGNNPKIKMAMQDIIAADARIGQAWSSYFPQITWTTNASKNRNLLFNDAIGSADATYNYYILGQASLSQLLYDFGVTQNKVTIKKIDYKTSKEDLTAVVNNIIMQTKEAYYYLLFTYDNKRVAEETVKELELFYNQAKAFYEIGMNPKVDVTIAEVNVSRAKLQLIQAENNIDRAVAKLNNILGLPYVTKYSVQERLSYQPLDVSLTQVMDIAKESKPELKAAQLKVESARQNVKLNKKAYFPTLTAEGNFAIGGKTFTSSYGYTFGAYLNFPNVNILKINKQIKEATALYDKQLAQATSTRNDIALEIQNAYYDLLEKKNQMPVSFLGVKQAKENYDLSFGRYRVGESTPIELRDAQVAYQEAQLTYYKALLEYNNSKANLEKAIGRNLIGQETIDLKP